MRTPLLSSEFRFVKKFLVDQWYYKIPTDYELMLEQANVRIWKKTEEDNAGGGGGSLPGCVVLDGILDYPPEIVLA